MDLRRQSKDFKYVTFEEKDFDDFELNVFKKRLMFLENELDDFIEYLIENGMELISFSGCFMRESRELKTNFSIEQAYNHTKNYKNGKTIFSKASNYTEFFVENFDDISLVNSDEVEELFKMNYKI